MIKTIDLRTLPTTNDKTTIIQDIPPNIKRFLELPSGIEKNYIYSKMRKDCETISLFQRGEDYYFSSTRYQIGKNNNSYYLKPSGKSGLSFKAGKLNIWFGKSIINLIHIDSLYDSMNWNFLEPCCKGFITKSILEKIFKGKVTNSRDVFKEYAKSVRVKASTEWLYRAAKIGLSKKDLNYYASVADNIDHFLQYYVENHGINPHFRDLVNQFIILDKKINFRWSQKRILQEHTEATKILMEFEIGKLSEEKIEYPELKIPNGFELIDNQKRAYIEGKTMNHCVYTNYWKRIERGEYVALHVKHGDENATLGLSIDSDRKLKLNQLYSYRNSQVSPAIRKVCEDWLKDVSEYKVQKPKIQIDLSKYKAAGVDYIEYDENVYPYGYAAGADNDLFF